MPRGAGRRRGFRIYLSRWIFRLSTFPMSVKRYSDGLILDKSPKTDISGKKFGKLTAIQFLGRNFHKANVWRCACECGNEKISTFSALNSGNTTSCGCSVGRPPNHIRERHGMRSFPEYKVWVAMKKRCNNPKCKDYPHYGGRGIKVSKEWENSFLKFISDMGRRSEENCTLERRDVNEGYCKENCYWTSWTLQQRNKRNNRVVKFRGVTGCLAEIAEINGLGRRQLEKLLR